MTRHHVSSVLAAIERSLKPLGLGDHYSVYVRTRSGDCFNGEPWQPSDGTLRLSRIDGIENSDTFVAVGEIESIRLGSIF